MLHCRKLGLDLSSVSAGAVNVAKPDNGVPLYLIYFVYNDEINITPNKCSSSNTVPTE